MRRSVFHVNTPSEGISGGAVERGGRVERGGVERGETFLLPRILPLYLATYYGSFKKNSGNPITSRKGRYIPLTWEGNSEELACHVGRIKSQTFAVFILIDLQRNAHCAKFHGVKRTIRDDKLENHAILWKCYFDCLCTVFDLQLDSDKG